MSLPVISVGIFRHCCSNWSAATSEREKKFRVLLSQAIITRHRGGLILIVETLRAFFLPSSHALLYHISLDGNENDQYLLESTLPENYFMFVNSIPSEVS